MKTILTLAIFLFVSACAQLPRTKPWECLSSIEPIDAVVSREEDGYFIYSCGWNGGDAGSDGDGDGDGEGAE